MPDVRLSDRAERAARFVATDDIPTAHFGAAHGESTSGAFIRQEIGKEGQGLRFTLL
jgi:hypothetical protein